MKRLGLILKASKIELRKILLLLAVGLCYSGTVTANNLPPYIYLDSTEGSSSTIVIENGNTVLFEATVGDQDNMGTKSVGIWWRVNSTTKKSDYGRSSYYAHTFDLPAGEIEKEYNVTISVRDNEYTYRSKTIKVIVRGKNRHYYLTDHLGSVRTTVSVFDANSNSSETGVVSSWDDYYPYGLPMPGRSENSTNADALNKFTGHEHDTQNDINLTYAGARYLDPEIGRFLQVDPHFFNYQNISPYVYVGNNPLILTDPTGMDWYDVNGVITWHDQEGELELEVDGEMQTFQSLGKNVLVGFHNRDENGNEEVNGAVFGLYLESNTDGATAWIKGNTVPADTEEMNTLAEGLYEMESWDYDVTRKDGSNVRTEHRYIIFGRNEDGSKNINIPTTKGGTMKGIYFHPGNTGRNSLSTRQGKPITEGCQTGLSCAGSLDLYKDFMSHYRGAGSYYLREW